MQSIDNIDIKIEDNRTENEKCNKPIKIIVNDVTTIIDYNVKQKKCSNLDGSNILQCNNKRKNKSRIMKKCILSKIEDNESTIDFIYRALPTSRDDDFVLVRQIFMKKFNCDFYWKEDDVNEFIGEYCNLYDDKAMRHFDRVTKYPEKCGFFWTAFYDCKTK